MSSKQKFRKPYTAYLDFVPQFGVEGGMRYTRDVPYSRLYLVPQESVKDSRIIVPLSEILLGYRKHPHALVYDQKSINHQDRRVHYQLRGLTTLASLKPVPKGTPRDNYHTPRLNWRYYYTFARGIRIPRTVKSSVRREVQAYGESLCGDNVKGLILSILNNNLNNQVEARISVAHPGRYKMLRGGFTFQVMPSRDYLLEQAPFEYEPPLEGMPSEQPLVLDIKD